MGRPRADGASAGAGPLDRVRGLLMPRERLLWRPAYPSRGDRESLVATRMGLRPAQVGARARGNRRARLRAEGHSSPRAWWALRCAGRGADLRAPEGRLAGLEKDKSRV